MNPYRITYRVQAPNRLMAWMAAGQMLRTGVHVTEAIEAKATVADWWEVTLEVDETDPPMPLFLHEDPEYADPLTMAKAEADRG